MCLNRFLLEMSSLTQLVRRRTCIWNLYESTDLKQIKEEISPDNNRLSMQTED